MKKNLLIVTVVFLSIVLAAVIGLAVWLELQAAKPDVQPTEPTQTTAPVETTEPTTVPTTVPTTTDTQPTNEDTMPTAPLTSWPEDELEDPVEPVDTQPQQTEPPETTKATEPPVTTQPQQTEPPTTAPEPTSGNPGGMGGPNEGEEDILE